MPLLQLDSYSLYLRLANVPSPWRETAYKRESLKHVQSLNFPTSNIQITELKYLRGAAVRAMVLTMRCISLRNGDRRCDLLYVREDNNGRRGDRGSER